MLHVWCLVVQQQYWDPLGTERFDVSAGNGDTALCGGIRVIAYDVGGFAGNNGDDSCVTSKYGGISTSIDNVIVDVVFGHRGISVATHSDDVIGGFVDKLDICHSGNK